jgi:hypothetical protein
MEISKEQQKIIDKAVKMLKPFVKESPSYCLYYFRESEGGDDLSDYDCCDSKKCYSKTEKELKKRHPDLEMTYSHNDGDHDKIGSCYQCGKPLNRQLTWVGEEFNHHSENSITKRDLKRSRTAFDVICMLEAMPSQDRTISQYSKHQNDLGNPKPLQEQMQGQVDFVNKMVEYAETVIRVLRKRK